jgi:hypothetical protein
MRLFFSHGQTAPRSKTTAPQRRTQRATSSREQSQRPATQRLAYRFTVNIDDKEEESKGEHEEEVK